jgi:multidrug efflux system membrane fusion protein
MKITDRPRHGAAALVLLALAAGCDSGGEAPPPQMPPTPVGVARVVAREVIERREFPGRFEAVSTVEIRPRVAGYLRDVHFREGDLVEAGDLLYTIDAREYEASLAAAEADVARARSRLDLAGRDVSRLERLLETDAVPFDQVDRARAEKAQAAADLALARARVASAALNVEFTRIVAPIRGRVGEARVRAGNLVTPGETLLTTMVTADPVYVRFEPDEQTYRRLQRQAPTRSRASAPDATGEAPAVAAVVASADGGAGGTGEGRGPGAAVGAVADATIPVDIGLAGGTDFPFQARLDFLANALDPRTGTISARAVLEDPEGRFTPGLFARVRVPVSAPAPALLVHEQAILTDQDRKYVYVVGEGDVAERRDVTLGPQVDGLRVIEDGLSADDRVVVSGSRKIFFPGAPIAPSERAMETPSEPLASAASS